MNKTPILLASLAFLALGGSSFAQGSGDCPVAKKCDALLARWDASAKEAALCTDQERAQFAQRVAEVAKTCPVGSRMGGALDAVQDVLVFVHAASAADAAHCPLEEAGVAEKYPEAMQMKAARTHVLASLERLATYAGGTTCNTASACSASASTAGAVAELECAKLAANCPIELASRIGTLKASFADARREAAALTAEQRGKIHAGFAALAADNEAVMLVPETVVALTEGLDALNQLHGEMGRWAEAHPEFTSQVPDSAHQSFMIQVALLDEAHGLLESVVESMHALQAPGATTVAGANR